MLDLSPLFLVVTVVNLCPSCVHWQVDCRTESRTHAAKSHWPSTLESQVGWKTLHSRAAVLLHDSALFESCLVLTDDIVGCEAHNTAGFHPSKFFLSSLEISVFVAFSRKHPQWAEFCPSTVEDDQLPGPLAMSPRAA